MLQAKLRARRWLRETEENPGQRRPAGDSRIWYAQGPRGSGKTRAGSEALGEAALTNPAGDWAVIGPTFGDARDTMVEHRKSGLLRVLGSAVEKWNRSNGELRLVNGAWIFCDGADDGAQRIQGKGLRGAWADEIGLWKRIDAWEESLMFAVREAPAVIFATGTPKGNKGIVKLLRSEPPGTVTFTHPTLIANRKHLAPAIVEAWERRYGGTRLGKQELEGIVLEDVEGALWRWDMIEPHRLTMEVPVLRETIGNRCVVAVDPAITATDQSDETGIVTAQTIPKGSMLMAEWWEADSTIRRDADHAVVLRDSSGIYSPTEWAKQAIKDYRELRADRIVVEANQGGEMARSVIHSVDPNVPVTLVWATQGKQPRAEPVSALYEQGRVHHAGVFPELESEQTTWVPGEPSPNHMDALVWGITDLLVDAGVPMTTHTPDKPVESLTGDLLDKVM